MANLHGENFISKILLPNGATYEIHDERAIHSLEELGLGNVLQFKGVKDHKNELPTEGNAIGDVWHVIEDEYEYVWAEINGIAQWEEFGTPHDFIGTDDFNAHIHSVTVTGENAASEVTGKVAVPMVSATHMGLKAELTSGSVSSTPDNVLGEETTFTTTADVDSVKIGAAITPIAIGGNGNADAITALGEAITGKAIATLNTTTVKNPTAQDVSIPNVTGNAEVKASKVTTADVSIPNVTGNTDVTASKVTKGSQKSVFDSAKVEGGVLSFGTTNVLEDITTEDVAASKVTLGAAIAASKVTAEEVSASKVTLGTAIAASKVTTENVTVATGAATQVDAITGFGDHTTAKVLTGVKVTTQPVVSLQTGLTDGINVVTGVSNLATAANKDDIVAADTETEFDQGSVKLVYTEYGKGDVDTASAVSVSSQDVAIKEGQAAAQVWTQKSGSTGTPTK